MKAKDILSEKGSYVEVIDPESTIVDAVHRLVDKNIGSLLVVEQDGGIAGIITERDILKECNRRPDKLGETKVRDVMTTELITGRPDEDVHRIQAIMTNHRVRHLPIVSGNRVEGLVSIGDVLKVLHEEAEEENRELKDYIDGKYI